MSNVGGPYQPPVDPTFGAPPARKKSSGVWIALLIVAILGGGAFVCCGGGILIAWFGLNVVAQEVADELRDHPVIQEQLGGIEDIDVDLAASAAKDDNEEFVFKVRGPKGSGTLTARTITDINGNEQVERASLRTANGTFEIVPE